jgi:hypothetical protein
LWRQGEVDGALREVQAAIDLETELARHNEGLPDRPGNEKNLAIFYDAKGKILDKLWVAKMDDRYYRDALAAYEQCRRHAESSPNDPDAQTAVLNAYLYSLDLQERMFRGSPTTPDSRRDLQAAVAAARKALEFARQRESRSPGEQARADLVTVEQFVKRFEGYERAVAGDKG